MESIDDLPDLPQQLQSRLQCQLQDIQKKADKARRLLNEAEVRAVRCHFFDFFCAMLKYFPYGISESVWERKNKSRQPRLLDIDPVKLFNYE